MKAMDEALDWVERTFGADYDLFRDARAEVEATEKRLSRLEALARKGLEAYHHGEACPFAFSTRPGNPAECEHAACREWAAALEGK